METSKQVQQIVGDLLDIDIKKINADTQLQDLAGWDSLAQLKIISAIEQEFGVSATMKQISQLNSIFAITLFVEDSHPVRH
ncbi:MAG TPA: acyl carrier protein [Methylophilaceae bacterium]|nr:acyl carrier protein [Methylophilaceae bacterium]